MNDLRTRLQGLWLPLITPFRAGEIDEASLRRLARHYADAPVDGLILAATSGEGLLLSAGEQEHLVNLVDAHLTTQDAICRSVSDSPAPRPPPCWTRSTKRRTGRSTVI